MNCPISHNPALSLDAEPLRDAAAQEARDELAVALLKWQHHQEHIEAIFEQWLERPGTVDRDAALRWRYAKQWQVLHRLSEAARQVLRDNPVIHLCGVTYHYDANAGEDDAELVSYRGLSLSLGAVISSA